MGDAAWLVEVGWVRPQVWRPPVEPSRLEGAVMARVKRAKLFVWLRQHRHELLDEGFQAELAGMYDDAQAGSRPCRQRSWCWRRSCRPTPVPAMMR
jgi:hypothetical protein